jgi:DNA-binding response OmpR family regulator
MESPLTLADPKAVDAAMGAGGDWYVTKPNRFEEWRAAVREIYDFGRQMRQAGND